MKPQYNQTNQAKDLRESQEIRKKTRACHDCGKPIYNYRCEECWEKLRNKQQTLYEDIVD